MRDFPHHHRRPLWAARLDRLWRWAAAVARPVLPRPADQSLTELARRDRPSPPIVVPTPAELGVVDHLQDGRLALSEGRHGDALHHFGELVRARPDNAWGWHGRGDALQLLGEPAEALVAYDRAVALQPDEGLHHGGRSNALSGLGRTGDAAASRQAALARDPGLSWMWSD